MDAPSAHGSRSSRRLALLTLGSLALAIAGFIALHALLSDAAASGDGRAPLLIAAAWTAVCAVLASLSSPRPRTGLLLTALGVAAIWYWQTALSRHIDYVYLAQHAGAHLGLGLVFARTLSAAHGPALITRLATRVHGSLPPAIERYTRQVTMGWTVYFFAMGLLSLVLFASTSLETWSILANLVTLPLIIAGFLVEYLLRHWLHPDFDHVSIFEGIRAYRSPRP